MSKKSQPRKSKSISPPKDSDFCSEKDVRIYRSTSNFCSFSPVVTKNYNIKQTTTTLSIDVCEIPRKTIVSNSLPVNYKEKTPLKQIKNSENSFSADMKENKKRKIVSNKTTNFVNKCQPQLSFELGIRKPFCYEMNQQKGLLNSSGLLNDIQNDEDFIDMKEYDIFHIDKIIRDKLKFHKTQLPQLKQELNESLNFFPKGEKSQDSRENIKKCSEIRKKIQDIEYSSEFALYIFRINDIIKKYKNILRSDNSRSFVCLNKTISDKEFAQKTKLISQFINIAREYINIKNYYRKAEILICLICNKDTMKRTIDDEAVLVCSVCGYEIKLLDDSPSFKDTDRLNMGNRYTYSRRSHFYEAMKKYQGKHNIDPEILKNVVAVLEAQMKLNNLTKETVTKNQLYTFLSENKLSNNYDDINLLFHIITGKPCPDFSKLEGTLLELFEQQEKALDEIAGDYDDGRINSINVYYKLYKLLQYLRYPCRKTDFCILKTKTKEDEHDDKMKKAWLVLGWKWIDTF